MGSHPLDYTLMALTREQTRFLRGRSHTLRPQVMIGDKGLGETVITEIERALEDHELIKVKIRADRADRAVIIDRIGTQTGAELVQAIGQTASFYRRRQANPSLQLPCS